MQVVKAVSDEESAFTKRTTITFSMVGSAYIRKLKEAPRIAYAGSRGLALSSGGGLPWN
jgi:hypothetical protein